MDSDTIRIPPKFWGKLSLAEMDHIFFYNDGHLSTKQIKLLWRTLRRTDTPPKAFRVDLSRMPEEFGQLLTLRALGAGPLPNVDNETLRRMYDLPRR